MFADKSLTKENSIQQKKHKLSNRFFSSLIFHCTIILIGIFSFKWSNRNIPREAIYSVDILPISTKSNIENKTKELKKDEKQKQENEELEKKSAIEPQEEAKPEIQKKEKDQKIEEKIINEPKLSDKKADSQPKKEEKQQKPVEKKKKAKPKDEDFDSLLKTLEKKSKQKIDDKTKTGAKETSKGQYNEKQQLSISLEDDIRRQIEKCWTPPSGGLDAGKLNILLGISLLEDGTVTNVKVLETSSAGNSQILAAATEAAVRAVKKCSPLQNLPIAQYESWKELEFFFDPSQMVY